MNSTYASQLEDEHRAQLMSEFTYLDEYRRLTHQLLMESAKLHQSVLTHRHAPRNISAVEKYFLRRLISDPSITIKPADKNLGLALVDTTWYQTELKKMLSDKTTYRVFTQRQTTGGKTKDCLKQLKQDLHAQVKILTARHKNELGLIDSAVPKFLEQFITEKTAKVPIIYLLIKVHKPSGLCGRPIVPSHSWLTTAMSKVVDHLLQQIIKEANITHLVKVLKSFGPSELNLFTSQQKKVSS